MNRLSRLRDAWAVLLGRKVAVKPGDATGIPGVRFYDLRVSTTAYPGYTIWT